MYQIDNSTAVAAIPASTALGTIGYFTDGNPATGVPATIMPSEFMNMLMMENLNVLAAAGIAPVKNQFNQLALAIAKIVQSGAAGAASETSAGILKLATSALAAAGTDNTTAITPQKLAAQIQAGGLAFAVDTGTANTYVCTFAPAITARTEGQILRFKVKTANTGASTVNDGVSGVALVGAAHAALQGGELVANGDAWIQWNTSVGTGSYILLFCTGAPEQVAPATQPGHAVNAGQFQSGALAFATDTGTANTYVCAFSPAITARAEGQVLRFKVKTANTGASTLNDGVSAAPLVGGAHAALQGGELIASGDAWVQWNSSVGAGSYILLLCTGAPEQVAPATKSQQAAQLSQLGNFNSTSGASASGTLTLASAGQPIVIFTPGTTQTLPAISTALIGTTFIFIAQNSVTVKAAGTDTITSSTGVSSATFLANAGEKLAITSGGGTTWYVTSYIQAGTVPAGTVINFAASTAPAGYLKANAAAVSRTTYAALFAAIGTVFGAGDGSTTFNLPELRGEFIRGFDDGRGIDASRVFASLQLDAFASHVHAQHAQTLLQIAGGAAFGGSTNGVNGGNTQATGGTETRPRNVALLACIKY